MAVPVSQERSPKRLMCAIFITPFVVLGLILLILWLSLRPHRPRFHIHEFSIPGMDHINGFHNAVVNFNVTVRNPNHRVWIYYESMRGTVYYKNQRVGVVPILDSYYQQPKNTTILQHVLTGNTTTMMVNNYNWMEFTHNRVRGIVVFRLRFSSILQYKKSMWDKKRHKMHVNCDVGVAPDGILLPSYINKKCHVHFH